MNFQLFKLFPETIAAYELTYDQKEEDFVKKFEFRDSHDSSNNDKASNSFMTTDLYILNKNNLLKNKLLNCVNHFIKEELGFTFDVNITTSWLTKTLPKGFSQEHTHALSLYSGVYYPCKTEHLYHIQFLKNENDFFQLSDYVKHFNHIHNILKFSVKQGTLLLFNSRLKHKVPKNETEEIRYSLAFNTMPIGHLGLKLGDSQYDFK
jgi:uncharacterized protein (TIGR02466 family)